MMMRSCCYPLLLILLLLPMRLAEAPNHIQRAFETGDDEFSTAEAKDEGIFGGRPPKPADFYSRSLVLFFNRAFSGVVCHGVLVAPDIVITGSDCNPRYQDIGNQMAIGVKSFTRNDDGCFRGVFDDCFGGEFDDRTGVFLVDLVIPPGDLFQGVAIWLLDEPVSVNGFASPTFIPSPDAGLVIVNGQDVKVFAYGETTLREEDQNPVYPETIEALYLVSFDGCSEASTYTKETQICAIPRRTSGLCFGDSGAPLYLCTNQNEFENCELIGLYVANFGRDLGEECSGVESPYFFARLSVYKTWIEQQICELSSAGCLPSSETPDECCMAVLMWRAMVRLAQFYSPEAWF